MNIYRHRKNKRLYTIDHLVLDMKHLNGNAFAGIYAEPYTWIGDTIKYLNGDHEKCELFVEQNFEVIAY
jgi:hypothetical protein